MRRVAAFTVIAAASLVIASAALAQDASGWHQLEVPGGRATLRALGVSDAQPRSIVMVELIRRLHLSTTPQTDLETALRNVPVSGRDTLVLPSPLPAAVWSQLLQRSIPSARLFATILGDTPARLLFHGLAGMDAPTRRWFEREPELLRRLYRNPDAIKSFALFAPAVRIAEGRIDVPAAATGERRWSEVLGAGPDQPARFIQRLFEDRRGRTAGLYSTIAFVEAPRREFLLRPATGRFARLVEAFAECYPADATDYPFAIRSNDAALLLMQIGLDEAGLPAGPRSQRFWQQVFDADDLGVPAGASDVAGGDAIDATWVVERVCAASATDRAAVFATLMAGHRTFADLPREKLLDAVIALRVRRHFPAIFMAMERAGVRDAATFGVVGRHAIQLDRLNDIDESPIALRQFQGALALTLSATAIGTWSQADAAGVLASMAAVPFKDGRYDGALADWIQRELLPSIRRALPNLHLDASAEEVVSRGLAGPLPASASRIRWEGLEYVVDFPAAIRERLAGVRARQGGATLDHAIESRKDGQLAQVLASWAYAPHVGAAGGGALVGGDGSLRHDFGLRSVNRTRFEQRWEVATAASDKPSISGSLLGLEAALANWSLRRLASDRIPSPPTIGANDLKSLFLTAALIDPGRLTDDSMSHLASAIAQGTRLLDRARPDPLRLIEAGRAASISPWRREVLPWLVAEEPDRLDEQFPLLARARLGGLREREAAAWGTASLATGCLCLQMPASRIPELILGRPADGMVGGQSADLMLRIAMILDEMQVPASLAAPVMSYAMRDFLDAVRPEHPADFDAYSRAALAAGRAMVEDYVSAIAAVGPLRPVAQ